MNIKLVVLLVLFKIILVLSGCSSPEEMAANKAEKEALKHLHSAQNGAAISQLKLGNAYFAGNGVAQDNKYAYMWVSFAVEQGLGASADESFEKIKADMTASEIEEAKKLALTCKKEKGYRDC